MYANHPSIRVGDQSDHSDGNIVVFDYIVRLQTVNTVGIHEETFHNWLYQEPQTLVWLHTMHRMNAAESGKTLHP